MGVFCENCNAQRLTWHCHGCHGSFCGVCIFQHRGVPDVTVGQVLSGWVDANELAEGMSILWGLYMRRLSSGAASDPAATASHYARIMDHYLCN